MSKFEFIPHEEQYQNSNIYKFMKKHNISSIEELSEKSRNNLEWFWESVEKDIGIYDISMPRRRAHAIAALPSSSVIPNFNN